MKILFVMLCIVLYYILGRLYVEVFMWPMIGNPRDYNDLYRGMKSGLRMINNYGMETDWWIEQEKTFGHKWEKTWVIVAENIWALCLIRYVIIDMKNSLIWLLKYIGS